MIDQYMIPAEASEFRWLNANMSTVTQLYENQRRIQQESQKRLFSGRKRRATGRSLQESQNHISLHHAHSRKGSQMHQHSYQQ